ncbi:single-stranded DNA-binding protein [Pedobacter frigoris]|uniref:single-stranded DNA-binding protein n=1 Tax=Pedobacter frigoris TaxID=2571272 RepID=UPI00292EB168|nr:single-stranded DNA-binding protein [Pedobacter frigoris]
MEITVRLTKDAEVRSAGNRQVVGLSGVINKTFKTKAGEVKKTATFFDCSYWRSINVAQYLTKGTVVQLSGDIGVNAYNTKTGEARASITFHINEILNWHYTGSTGKSAPIPVNQFVAAGIQDEPDDLPF